MIIHVIMNERMKSDEREGLELSLLDLLDVGSGVLNAIKEVAEFLLEEVDSTEEDSIGLDSTEGNSKRVELTEGNSAKVILDVEIRGG